MPKEAAAAIAEVGYGKDGVVPRIEVVLPHGTKLKDLARFKFQDFVARLPRGCQACLSGEPLIIRERLEHVVRIDLETGKVIG
jgi:hypothetical protein